jgi:hypothetical protein
MGVEEFAFLAPPPELCQCVGEYAVSTVLKQYSVEPLPWHHSPTWSTRFAEPLAHWTTNYCVTVPIDTARKYPFRILSDSLMCLHFLLNSFLFDHHSIMPTLLFPQFTPLPQSQRSVTFHISGFLFKKKLLHLCFYTTLQASSFCNTKVIKFYLIPFDRGGQNLQPHFTRQLTQELCTIKIKYPPPLFDDSFLFIQLQ